MNLHRIRLRNYRGVRDNEVSFSERGVTIVEGPNEIGKTSISEALGLAIEYLDSSNHRSIRSLKPVDRDEGPEVEIELTTGPYSLVYQKRWLRRPTTTLGVTAPRNENHTGRAAHERLLEILKETLDDDLRRALQIEQGTELKLPSFSIPSMRRALESAAGGDVTGADDDTLMDRIRTEYERYWTPTGRTTGDRRTLQNRVDEARKEVEGLKLRMAEIDQDVNRLAALSDEAKRIAQTLRELGESEGEYAEQWNATEGLRVELKQVDALHSGAESRRQQAFDKWSRREEMKGDVETRAGELRELEESVEKASPALIAATRGSEEAAKALEGARDDLRRARDMREIAVGDERYLRQQIELEQITERSDRIVENQKMLKEAEEYIQTAEVDEVVLNEIEEAYLKYVRANAAYESAAASLVATALSEIRLEVNGEETTLSAGETRQEYVEEKVTLVVPNVVQVEVTAASDAKSLAEQRRVAEEEYQRLCNSNGVADLAEARKEEQARRDALRNRERARKGIRDDLRDLTLEQLQAMIPSLTESVAAYPFVRPEEPLMPSDWNEANQIALDSAQVVREREEAADRYEAASADANKQLSDAQIGNAELAARVEGARERLEEATRRLEDARTNESDEALAGSLALAQRELEIFRERLEKAEGQLEAMDPASVQARLESVRGAKKRAELEQQTNQKEENGLRGRLEALGEEGLHSAQEEAQGRLDQAEREHEGVEARAEASKLLWETFERHRRQATQRYVQPFKEKIDQFGRIVFGPSFEVELSEELEVVGRTVDGVSLETEQLSTGAREQLGVLSRLACAAIVSPEDGGVPVMIDDALGWTDPQRLQSMGAAINEAGKGCQIVILTCFPGRYAHVGNAKVVNL